MPIGDQFESVLAAARAGAGWAFERLYEEFHPALLRYFASRARREAEDLASEVWLGVAERLGSFEGGEREFRSWMFTIAHRRLADHWSAGGRRVAFQLDDDDEAAPPAHDDPAGEVVDAVAAHEAAARIAAVLNPTQAEVVLLRLVAGLDVEEVAAILHKRPGTIRVIQHRAVQRLIREISLEDVTG